MVKVTFSLDDETMEQIRRTAARLGKPQSHVVRDAVGEYAARTDRLTERERLQLLSVLAEAGASRPTRSARAVDAELRSIRADRRRSGRRSA